MPGLVPVIASLTAVILTCIGTAAIARQAAQTPKQAAKPGRSVTIGRVTVNNMEQSDWEVGTKASQSKVVLRGPTLNIKSARYDLAAPRIDLTLTEGVARTAQATGGARVDVRNPEAEQSTTLTSETATYTAAAPGRRARINFPAQTHIVTRDPNLESTGPLDVIVASAYVEFLDNDTYSVHTGAGNASATVKDEATQPKSKKGPAKP